MTNEERKVTRGALTREMDGYKMRLEAAKVAGDEDAAAKWSGRVKSCEAEIKKYAQFIEPTKRRGRRSQPSAA